MTTNAKMGSPQDWGVAPSDSEPNCFLGEKQAKFPGALPANRFHEWQALVFAANGVSHGTGFGGDEVASPSLPRKMEPGENRPRYINVLYH